MTTIERDILTMKQANMSVMDMKLKLLMVLTEQYGINNALAVEMMRRFTPSSHESIQILVFNIETVTS